MTRRWLFLPVAALVVLAAILGWRAGQPVSESDILNAYAARWLAAGGAAATECYGRPGDAPGVRMIVVCEDTTTTMIWHVDDRGREVAPPQEPAA